MYYNLNSSYRRNVNDNIQKFRSITFRAGRLYIQWCSRNSKSHFAGNLLANRRTNLTLIVRLGAKSDLLIEQLLISEHYCI